MNRPSSRYPQSSIAPTRQDRDGSNTLSIHDSSTEAQRIRQLTHLRHSAVSTIEARRDLNILYPAMRVKDLREAGHNIVTHRITITDDQGREHSRVALYTLIGDMP